MHIVRLGHAMSHMEVTPRLWRDSLGQEETVPNLQEWGVGNTGEIHGFHILSWEENMIFRGNLTRNFYPASLG